MLKTKKRRRRWKRDRNPLRQFWFWLVGFFVEVRRCICGRDFLVHTSRKQYCSPRCGAHDRARKKREAGACVVRTIG